MTDGKHHRRRRILKAATLIITVSVLVFIGGAVVWAWNNPTAAPPGGAAALYVDSSQRVGVGVSVPAERLDVAGNVRFSGGHLITNQDNGALIVNAGPDDGSDNAGIWFRKDTTLGDAAVYTDLMRIKHDGNVGIGIVNPNRPLMISSAGNPGAVGTGSVVVQGSDNKERFETRSFAAVPGPGLQGIGARGTVAAPNATQSGDSILILGGGGYDNAASPAWTGNRVIVRLMAAENFTTTAQGTALAFETTPLGSTVRAERARIDPDGNVGIGTTAPLRELSIVRNRPDIGIQLRNTALGGRPWNILSSGTGSPNTVGSFSIQDGIAGATRLFIGPGGNVGMGTTLPAANLSVERNAADVSLQLGNSTAAGRRWNFLSSGTGSGNPAGSLGIQDATAGATRLLIDSSGLVGVGTTAPLSRLTVGGAVSLTNNAVTLIAQDSQTLASTVDSVQYPFEFRANVGGGNRARLLMMNYRRAAGSDWQTSGWRLQAAVDSSFTEYDTGKAYLEFYNGNSGELYLGTAGTDRVRITDIGNINVLTNRVTNLGTPIAAKDAVTKEYVDNATGGSNSQKIWGEGRSNTGVINTAGECTVGGVKVSRSSTNSSWDSSAAACPRGWWVCTENDRGGGACGAGDYRRVNCDPTAELDEFTDPFTANAWVADAHVAGQRYQGRQVSRTGPASNESICSLQPVWCCS